MRLGLKQLRESFLQKTMLSGPEPDLGAVALPDIFTQIEQAKLEWKQAANYFDNVSDPELVDYAILLREAAERKYMYLLKQAKLAETRAFVWNENVEAVASADTSTHNL